MDLGNITSSIQTQALCYLIQLLSSIYSLVPYSLGFDTLVELIRLLKSSVDMATPTSSLDNAMLSVAHHIVENIEDYPSLVRLSMTCKLFKELVKNRKTLQDRLFDTLEQGVLPDFIPTCAGKADCWCNGLRETFGSFPASHECSAIALYVPNLKNTPWLPCYGCHQMKKREEFDRCQSTLCSDLHSCQSEWRRCSICYEELFQAALRPGGRPVCFVRAL